MEGRRVSLVNCVPTFAQGTDILLAHNDTLCLSHLSSLLRQCSFKVTATNQASAATDMVFQQEGRFKLVMAKANMPDMSTLPFLNALLLRHITVIFISSGQNDGGAKAAFDRGLCYLLQEPVQSVDLISLWQQVYNSNNRNSAQENHAAKSKQKVHESSENQDRTHHDVKIKKTGKRALNSNQVKLDNNNHGAEKEGEEIREHNNDRFRQKKSRISWTSDLHHKFLQAISVLGENDIRPKLIKEIMNVPDLTCRHIASHLQKFKSQERRLQDKCNIHLLPGHKPSNFKDGTKSSSMQSQYYPCYSTLGAFQNENHSQNNFPLSFSGTEELEIFQMQENPGCANFSCQHQAELVNYGNQDLETVVRGAVSGALMDQNQYDNFGNGCTEDDSALNSEIQTNRFFGNSSIPQKSDSIKPCFAKPSAILGELEPYASINQRQTPTEDKNILRIVGGDSEGYDCFRRGPDHNTQNSEILSYIHGYNTSDSCNPSSASLLKAKPSAVMGGHELIDQNKILTAHENVLRFLGEGCDCFGNGPCPQNSEMLLRNSVLGYNFGLQKSDNYNPSCTRLLKSKIDALKIENQTSTEYNNISRFLEEDCDTVLKSMILRNSVPGNSSISRQSDYCNTRTVRSLKAKPRSVSGGTIPDGLMDHDKTLTEYNNMLRILGVDFDAYGYFETAPSSDDIPMLKYAVFGDCWSP